MRILTVPGWFRFYVRFLVWAWRMDACTFDTCSLIRGSIFLPYTILVRPHWAIAILGGVALWVVGAWILALLPFVHIGPALLLSELFTLLIVLFARLRIQDEESDLEETEKIEATLDTFENQDFRTRSIGSKILWLLVIGLRWGLGIPLVCLVWIVGRFHRRTCFFLR